MFIFGFDKKKLANFVTWEIKVSVCPSIFLSLRKCSKSTLWERACDTGTHTFGNVLAPIFIIFQFRGTSLQGKLIGFSINIPWLGKMQQTASYEESLENWYPYFSQSVDVSLPSDSHPVGRFITLEMHGFFHNFLIVQKTCIKTYPIRKNWDIHLPWTPIPRYHGTVV